MSEVWGEGETRSSLLFIVRRSTSERLMSIAFLAERTTRDMSRRLGTLTIDDQASREMTDLGQALMIGKCETDRTVRKIAGAIRNLRPAQSVVVCHSYELADRIVEECIDLTLKPLFLWGSEPLPRALSTFAAVVTVPENLQRIGHAVIEKKFSPKMLFLLDPNGITFRGFHVGGERHRRAGNIVRFRSICLAEGLKCLTVVCVGCSPAAFGLESLCETIGVESLIYADGGT